jgi:hypothetical protein
MYSFLMPSKVPLSVLPGSDLPGDLPNQVDLDQQGTLPMPGQAGGH